MVETTGTGLRRVKEEEIELDLGLSIGRSFRKAENPKLVENKAVFFQHAVDSKANGFDANLRKNHESFTRSSVSPVFIRNAEQETVFVDPQRKREMKALRRQEAKKKREEKQHKKGLGRVKNGECLNVGFLNPDDDKMWPKAQIQRRVKDREAKENEADNEERARKNEKVERFGSEHNEIKNVNMYLSNEQITNHNGTPNPTAYSSSSPYPVLPMQYPYPHSPLQYVPYTNGFGFPFVMQCWANGATAGTGNEKNVFQPEACRSCRPFRWQSTGWQSTGLKMSNGCDSGQNGSRDGGNMKVASNGSSMCSSSVVSDYQSSSHEGGGSSDTKSHSSYSQPEHPQMNGSTVDDAKGQFEHSASSHSLESCQGIGETTNCDEKMVPSNVTQSSPTAHKGEAISETPPAPTNKAISTTKNTSPGPLKESKGDLGKPPKPQTQNHNITPSLLQMPCVSTTGNGPNGKTITGFLYRYSKTEVSIICVCHGSSFSPAEFVQHAGSTNVTHPLRHITVIPSALG